MANEKLFRALRIDPKKWVGNPDQEDADLRKLAAVEPLLKGKFKVVESKDKEDVSH